MKDKHLGMMNAVLRKIEKSQAWAQLCEDCFGKNLSQYNMADMPQLDLLITELTIQKQDKVLDLGCGVGKITEYISDKTGCEILGIDITEKIIETAKARTIDKSNRLNYQVLDFEELSAFSIKFTKIIAIDALYFVKETTPFLQQLKSLLHPKGMIGILHNDFFDTSLVSTKRVLTDTKLAKSFQQNGFKLTLKDLTPQLAHLWEKQLKAVDDLDELFLAEGNFDLYLNWLNEVMHLKKEMAKNRVCRLFYKGTL